MAVKLRIAVLTIAIPCGWNAVHCAAAAPPETRPLQSIADQLPPPISDGLYVEGWLWLADLQNNSHPRSNYYDAELSFTITKSFDQQFAATAQVNFIDANNSKRVELEQAFVSAWVWRDSQTMLTVGKFNANFGIEPRDFWNRRTGTTSLLFSAQPQDIIGAMLTQPLGNSGVTLRPFISADFQGAFYFDQPPSAGLMVEYQPSSTMSFALTNWVGPGFDIYSGHPLRQPFPQSGYGYDGAAVTENWQGPNLVTLRGGTLYFVEAKASVRPVKELMLAAEYIFARTGSSDGPFGWSGWMVLADYAVTDRLHVFGRYSALDDTDWIITGFFEKDKEISAGAGYQLCDGVEIRGEYRHDFSNLTPDFDSVSIHLSVGF